MNKFKFNLGDIVVSKEHQKNINYEYPIVLITQHIEKQEKYSFTPILFYKVHILNYGTERTWNALHVDQLYEIVLERE